MKKSVLGRIKIFVFLGIYSVLICCSSWKEAYRDVKYNNPEVNDSLLGPCKKVPPYYKLDEIIFGQGAQGAEGNYSCYSDIFTTNGIRISPFLNGGRVFFDFGEINKDSVNIILKYSDNAWFNGEKDLEIYNWITNKWQDIYTWFGNDGIEHTIEIGIKLNDDFFYNKKKIRIGIYSSWVAVIHLKSIIVL